MKQLIKKALPYIIALIVGVVTMIFVIPAAKAAREVPALWGGELCIPVLTVIMVLIARTIRNDIKSEMLNQDEEDDE